MTYHTSRIPLAVDAGHARRDHRRRHGGDGLQRGQTSRRRSGTPCNVDGKQYAVPLDTHPIVLYYNKDKLAAAGLIGDNGLPKDLNGIDNFNAALKKLQDGGTKWAMSTYTAGGNFQFRTIYSLLCQQDGEMLTDGEWLAGDNKDKLDQRGDRCVSDWVKDGYVAGLHRISGRDRPLHLRRSGDAHQRRLGSADDDRPRQRRASSASSGARSSCRCSSTTPAPIRTRTPSRSRTTSASRRRRRSTPPCSK